MTGYEEETYQMTQRITAGEGSGKMKKLYLFYCLIALSISFFLGILAGMTAMRDFITDEYIVIDPEKLRQYQQLNHPQPRDQGITV